MGYQKAVIYLWYFGVSRQVYIPWSLWMKNKSRVFMKCEKIWFDFKESAFVYLPWKIITFKTISVFMFSNIKPQNYVLNRKIC